MKKIIAISGLLLVSGYFYSRQSNKDTTETSTTVEIQDEEYKASITGWTVGLEKAYAESKRTGKPIMANFTGSDWCGWCMKLKSSVFNKPEFQTWAKENVVLYEVDFPRKTEIPEEIKKQNAGLQQSLQVTGFPTVWIIDIDKVDDKYSINAHGKLSYEQKVATFTNKADKILKNK